MPRRALPLALLLACAAPALAAPPPPQDAALREVRDRAAIHALLVAYGETLDRRDFDGFGRLFAREGVYDGGFGTPFRGGPAAAAGLKDMMAKNPLNFAEPNFHVFLNEVVTLEGTDRARATSMSFFVVPDEANRPQPRLMARYEDVLIREDGGWKFLHRKVIGLIPAPRR